MCHLHKRMVKPLGRLPFKDGLPSPPESARPPPPQNSAQRSGLAGRFCGRFHIAQSLLKRSSAEPQGSANFGGHSNPANSSPVKEQKAKCRVPSSFLSPDPPISLIQHVILCPLQACLCTTFRDKMRLTNNRKHQKMQMLPRSQTMRVR